ncbi:MAG: fused MFS/spermidine synthase, partial [Gammaproteobacteria bacterium]|nr:fused MFS/spermidine synthase [Gammaproteobacteria bacterium]
PYAVLSATGPLLQQWFARQFPGRSPYFLYSWSNAASLLALLSFPFLIEPNLTSLWQTRSWSLGFVCYGLLMLMLAIRLWRSEAAVTLTIQDTLLSAAETANQATLEKQPLSASAPWFWLGYSALGVVFLVATTNAMTQNVAPVPFLWVVPLAIYLLTFIVSFQSTRWYQRSYALWVLGLVSLIAVMMHFIGTQFNLTSQLCIYLGLLTIGCLICHAELAQAKPASSRLTSFYLMLALGGCVGSAFVAFVATALFDQFLEFPLAFVALLLVLAIQQLQTTQNFSGAWSARLLQFFWQTPARRSGFVALAFAMLSSGLLLELNRQFLKSDVYRARNFYGVLSVKDVTLDGITERRLIDGSTSHGTQYVAAKTRSQALSYYRPGTGAAQALALKSAEKGPIKAGFIGLGAGTLAAYGQVGDQYRFYELNPAVVHVAQQYFSYLGDSKAQISLIEGDGRVSLQQELRQGQSQQFDVLVIDAFAGDSIPQHLLTLEAMALYQQHLAPGGIIAVHISNTHLNLLPLMAGTAEAMAWQLGYFMTPASKEHPHQTEWVWLTTDVSLLDAPSTLALMTPIDLQGKSALRWTDQYSDLVSLLK